MSGESSAPVAEFVFNSEYYDECGSLAFRVYKLPSVGGVGLKLMAHTSTKKTIQKELDDTSSAAENDDDDDGNHDDERYSPPRQRNCHELSGKDTRTERQRRSSRLANRASDVVLKSAPVVGQPILCMKDGGKLLPFHGTLHGTKEEAEKQSRQVRKKENA